MNVDDIQHEISNAPRYTKVLLILGLILSVSIVFVFSTYAFLMNPPYDFPENSTISIPLGSSAGDIADLLATENYVRSSTLLYVTLLLNYDTSMIHAGRYEFTKPISTSEIARHLVETGPVEDLISITFPEGIPVAEIARIAEASLPQFSVTTFLSIAREKEGYLFPDTYFVPDTFTTEQLYDLMTSTAESKFANLSVAIQRHPLTEYEIITLASIIEREANSPESMRLVSSVLQNRLKAGMPLQADASIEYALDKPLRELVPEDLEIESPYNTYLNIGLPPTPIGNPGLTAIAAVLNPADSEYFYYITDNDGVFHYAETYEKHRYNIAEYLR